MAKILEFPKSAARPNAVEPERVVAETYWVIVKLEADGSKRISRMRSPQFLSPNRAYAQPCDGAAGAVRSLLMYKLRPSAATPAVDPSQRYRCGA